MHARRHGARGGHTVSADAAGTASADAFGASHLVSEKRLASLDLDAASKAAKLSFGIFWDELFRISD